MSTRPTPTHSNAPPPAWLLNNPWPAHAQKGSKEGTVPFPPSSQQKKHRCRKGQSPARRLTNSCVDKKGGSIKPEFLRPHVLDVVSAVDSLYADRLKPFGRILLKRVREKHAMATQRSAGSRAPLIPDTDAVPLIDPKCLRRICDTCSCLTVHLEDGKEYSVALQNKKADFVDVCSPLDTYPPVMWKDFADYLENIHGPQSMFPGGRYACAQVLLQRRLPFLRKRSLGELCHIVQLAVSQKRILGYLDGNMVPFGRSSDWMKEQCAVRGQPVVKKTDRDLPVASWQQARRCIMEILDQAQEHQPGGEGIVTLSNVKRLFRSRFELDLSETALGHSRLNELLQDPRLADICTLELQGKSHVVIQRMQPRINTVAWQTAAFVAGATPSVWPPPATLYVQHPMQQQPPHPLISLGEPLQQSNRSRFLSCDGALDLAAMAAYPAADVGVASAAASDVPARVPEDPEHFSFYAGFAFGSPPSADQEGPAAAAGDRVTEQRYRQLTKDERSRSTSDGSADEDSDPDGEGLLNEVLCVVSGHAPMPDTLPMEVPSTSDFPPPPGLQVQDLPLKRF